MSPTRDAFVQLEEAANTRTATSANDSLIEYRYTCRVNERIRRQLLAINQNFYEHFAKPFATSRANPQPGFERVLAHVPAPCERVLDVGSGEGRFGRFLQEARADISYVGVDFSADLLACARETVDGAVVHVRDISGEGSLADLGAFDLVVCFAVLQHIPGWRQRARLLKEMGQRLEEQGRLIISTWQFMDSDRQRRKIVDWDLADVSPETVEANDYLLTWKSGGYGLRYVAYIDASEIKKLAQTAGLQVIDSFRSDGREGDLNLYTVLALPGQASGELT